MKKNKVYRGLLLAGLVMMQLIGQDKHMLYEIQAEEIVQVEKFTFVEESVSSADVQDKNVETADLSVVSEQLEVQENMDTSNIEGDEEYRYEEKLNKEMEHEEIKPEENSDIYENSSGQENTEEQNLITELFADFTFSVSEDILSVKAGQQVGYEVVLENTGYLDLKDIELRGIVDNGNLSGEWLPVSGLSINEADGTAALNLLEAGQVREVVYMVSIPEDFQTNLEVEFLAKSGDLCKAASLITEVTPLKIDFTVKKWADRIRAVAGDTITYQICIRNIGERSLHSVLTTEKFQTAGLKAQFQEQEGVILNGAKTEALIAEIKPGEAVGLYAVVVVPEDYQGGDLLNEVVVVTRETGETSISAQSTVEVEKIHPTEIPYQQETPTYESTNYDKIKQIPQTSDLTESELWAGAFGISSLIIIGIYWLRKGKRKR